MRDETASLVDAIEEYLADVRHRLKPSSWRIYRHNLHAYSRSLGGGQLRDLTLPKVKAYVNRYVADGKIHAAHNKMIELKALATYLAKEAIFYAPGGISTLAGVPLPHVGKQSRPAFERDEVLGAESVIAPLSNVSLLSAIHWLQLATGIRANETRLLLLRDATLPNSANNYQGHITVREETTKTDAGFHEIPLDERAAKALRRYLGDGRPAFSGSGPEPLFLTQPGHGFTEGGWHSMQQRLRRKLDAAGFPGYKQHRNRNTWTRDALEAGIPENCDRPNGGLGERGYAPSVSRQAHDEGVAAVSDHTGEIREEPKQ